MTAEPLLVLVVHDVRSAAHRYAIIVAVTGAILFPAEAFVIERMAFPGVRRQALPGKAQRLAHITVPLRAQVHAAIHARHTVILRTVRKLQFGKALAQLLPRRLEPIALRWDELRRVDGGIQKLQRIDLQKDRTAAVLLLAQLDLQPRKLQCQRLAAGVTRIIALQIGPYLLKLLCAKDHAPQLVGVDRRSRFQ